MDRNSIVLVSLTASTTSLSARRAWIEIGNSCTQALPEKVALRKESVDRNISREISLMRPYVALRKESVDRNKLDLPLQVRRPESLSARRAWIEMGITRASIWLWVVALRKESVDRNIGYA